MAIYLDVLSPLRRLSLAFQQERDDPWSTHSRVHMVNGKVEALDESRHQSDKSKSFVQKQKLWFLLPEHKTHSISSIKGFC